jgi:hypothetical protein
MSEEDTFQEVVYTGVSFLRAMTAHYGPDRGYELWDNMAQTVGEEVRGAILMHMLSVNSIGRRVSFRTDKSYQAVTIIKAIRTATGLGLKEAKDLYDVGKMRMASAECTSNKAAITLMADLRNCGCEVL